MLKVFWNDGGLARDAATKIAHCGPMSLLWRIDPGRPRVTAGPRLEGGDGLVEQIHLLLLEFDPDFLLRGSVRRSADTIRITVQLHDPRDRSVVWLEAYDRRSGDLLAIQEEVARRVSRSLALELLPSATLGSPRYSLPPEAYDAYMKGRYFWHRMTPDAIHRSMAYFREAPARDSGFAPAYAGLADFEQPWRIAHPRALARNCEHGCRPSLQIAPIRL